MKTLIASLAIAAAMLLAPTASFSAPLVGLTPHQVHNALNGFKVGHGGVITKKEVGARSEDLPDIVTDNPDITVDNPDIVTETGEYVQTSSGNTDHLVAPDNPNGGWWNEKCQTIAYVNADCTVLSIADHDRSSSVYVTKVVTTDGGTTTVDGGVTVTDGGTTTIVTCTKTTADVGFQPHGPTPGFTIDFSSSTSDGSC